MNNQEIEIIKNFIHDKELSGLVKQLIIDEIKSKDDGEANVLAARFIAICEIDNAWDYMANYANPDEDTTDKEQIGL